MSTTNLLVLLLAASTLSIESIAYDLLKHKPSSPPSHAPTPYSETISISVDDVMLAEELNHKPSHPPSHAPAPSPTHAHSILAEELKHRSSHPPSHAPAPSPKHAPIYTILAKKLKHTPSHPPSSHAPAPSPKHVATPYPETFDAESMLHEEQRHKPSHPPSPAPTPYSKMFDGEDMLAEVLKHKPKHKPNHPPSPALAPSPKHMKKPSPPQFLDMAEEAEVNLEQKHSPGPISEPPQIAPTPPRTNFFGFF